MDRTYTTGLSYEAFQDDRKTVDAVVRNLEVIGEAVKQIPEISGSDILTLIGKRSPACATA